MANSVLSFRREFTKGRGSLPRVTALAKAWTVAQGAHRTNQSVICASGMGTVTASVVKRTHYQVLGVQPMASPEDIRTAFRRLAKSLHPDHNKVPGAREKFQEVKEAYDILADTTARADYDRDLKIQAMAAAATAAQAASGGRRASTTIVRRSRPAGSGKNQAAARPSSGDDFDVFTAPNNSPNRSSSVSNYNCIFNEPQRAGSGGSATTYRSVLDATSKATASDAPPRRTAPVGRSGSSGNGPPSSPAGYQSIFNGSSPPRSVSAGRSGGSNPCIFNGRAISPNLGITSPPAAAAAASIDAVKSSPSSSSTRPYGPRASGPANTATASPSPAGSSNVGGVTVNTVGNTTQVTISTNANERSKGTASAASRSFSSKNAGPVSQAVSTCAAARATASPPAQAPGAGSTAGIQRTASTSYVPYTVSPSLGPGVGAKAASTPSTDTSPVSRPAPESSQPVAGATASTAATEGATSSGASISDVAARLAAMTAAASSRSGSGESGSYSSRIDGGVSTGVGTPITSGTGLPRSVSPSQSAKGDGNITSSTVPPSSAATGATAASGTAFQVSVALKVPGDNAIRISASDSSSPNQQQQPLAMWPEHQTASPPDREKEQPRVARAVSVADAEAAARVAAAMAAAAEAKAAAAAAEAMAAEAAAVAARAKAAAMAAEARLSAVVEATGSDLPASPPSPPADEDVSISGAEPAADTFRGAKGPEETGCQERLGRPPGGNVVPQVKDFVRKVGSFFAP